ncbi:MAG: BatD family protein [Planctomycetes bacterium]|nr:BatD family protein [Planctomycetota bacterium]
METRRTWRSWLYRCGLLAAVLFALEGTLHAQRLRLEQDRVRAGQVTMAYVTVDGSKLIEVLEGPSCDGLVIERLADGTESQRFFDSRRGQQVSIVTYLRWSVRSNAAGKFSIRGPRIKIDEVEQTATSAQLEVLGDTPSKLGFVELEVTPARIVREQKAELHVDIYFPALVEPRSQSRSNPLDYLDRLREPQMVELPWISSEGAPNLPAGLEGEDLQAWVNGLTRHRGRIALAIAQRGLTLFSSRTTIPYASNDLVERASPDGVSGSWYHMRYTYALRGEAVGKYAIGPARLLGATVEYQRGSLVQSELYTSSAPVELEVVEPPREGRPAEWSGAIGSFTFELPPPTPQRVELGGEPVRLTLVVRGSGSLAGMSFGLERRAEFGELFHVQEPVLFEAPPPGEQAPPNHPRHEGETWRHFEYRLLPLREGTHELPTIAFAWFDPERGTYERAVAPTYRIEVLPSTRPAPPRESSSPAASRPRAPRSELAPDVADLNLVRDERPRWFSRLLLITSAGVIWLGAALLAARRAARELSPRARRRRDAGERALLRLRTLPTAESGASARLEGAAAALAGYFADRADVREEGLTGREVSELARAEGIGAKELEKIERLFAQLEAARFGGWSAGRVEEELVALHTLIEALARRPEQRRGRAVAPILLLALGAQEPGTASDDAPEPLDAPRLFQRALQSTDEERWADAERDYMALLERGVDGGAVLFNLGNVYARWGERDAEALACYRRALRVWPTDANLASNLDALLGKLPADGLRPPSDGWFLGLFAWRRDLPFATLLDSAALAGVLALLAAALRAGLGPKFALGRIALAVGIVALVLGLALSIRWHETREGTHAVLRRAELLRGGPASSFESVGTELSLGSELQVEEQRISDAGAWVRVVSVDRAGWLPREALVIY